MRIVLGQNDDLTLQRGEVQKNVFADMLSVSQKGQANGVASLDNDGHVPAEQLENDYPDLTAGNIVGEFTQQAEFGYRPSAGTVDVKSGYKVDHGGKVMGVKGNTVAWNQICSLGTVTTTDNYGISKYVKGHLIYISGNLKSEANAYFSIWGISDSSLVVENDNNWHLVKGLLCRQRSEDPIEMDVLVQPINGEPVECSNLMVIDLTLIYGAGNEPETAAEFEEDYFKWFGKPLSYEAYDEGSLRSVKMTGLKTVGFNQWDEEWENGKLTSSGPASDAECIRSKNFCSILPGKQYYLYCAKHAQVALEDVYLIALYFYDEEKNFISGGFYTNTYFVTPSNAKYFKLTTQSNPIARYGGVYDNDICIHLRHSGSRDGDYESYWESQMSLAVTSLTGKLLSGGEPTGSSVVVFSDGMKSAGSVRDEIVIRNGKTYAIKRVGSVDMGTLTYELQAWASAGQATALVSGYGGNCGIMSGKYQVRNDEPTLGASVGDGQIAYSLNNKGHIWMEDSALASKTAQEYAAALSGVYLFFELATPEEYILDDFELPLDYDVDDWGTEEVLLGTNGVAPVLDLKYGLNAAGTLKNLPNSYVSVNAQTLTSDQQERVKRNLGLTNPSSIGIDSEVQTITANTSVTIPTGNWASKTIVFVNGGSSALTVTVPTSGVQTPDGQAIELTCPVGGYCEVSLLKIGSIIYARGI